ncbi:hypothetical protein LTR78_005517 [Recurvomyces mirabilis]|uniref:Uncharacterized protein n=1 Tax=Recurvomyces mirabilis TaxID=574656 RepID=A0AAE0WMH1_9PEZI|nr:hypothetical protein LTR78_005517 [Recurvomyces mirabilis]KAK5158492.1 hypothetical protein LTS14_003511 [Recurvomyces mirabilis]
MDSGDEEKALQLNCGLHRQAPSTAPDTIVLGLWPYATDEQTRYYVQGYEALYPDAQLLLLQYSTSYDKQLGDALDALTASQEKRALDAPPNVLLHLFSGCGAAQGCRLLRTYKIRTGQRLPVKAVVMDSLPALRVPTIHSIMASPYLVLSFLYTLLTMMFVRMIATLNYFHFEQRRRQNRHDLNNPFLIPPDARKCYIFEERDLMFSWHDSTQDQADEECIRDDISVKRTSIDEKGRLTGDQTRYWTGIDNVWNGST